LAKYFPADVRNKKEIEFLELKQENMTIAKYATKFEELSRFCLYINAAEVEVSKYLKFKNDLRQFSFLVTTCIIYEDDSKAMTTHYKTISEKRGTDQSRVSRITLINNKTKR